MFHKDNLAHSSLIKKFSLILNRWYWGKTLSEGRIKICFKLVATNEGFELFMVAGTNFLHPHNSIPLVLEINLENKIEMPEIVLQILKT